ncbi:MAG TPA: aminopeptidase N [Xanthobacteraceae bacterium]|jgi:aminopeptidase N|nr:aminopeptidase N [Xanthobacteraceae bacterium]
MRTEEPRPIRLADYRPPDWLIETVDLDVSLHPTASTVRATLKIKPNATGTPAPLVLDGDDIRLRALALDGKPLATDSFVATPDRLTIAQVPNRPFTLEIETAVDPTGNTQLMGLYRAGTTYCTQCEAEGFRRITYFLDRPDVMAVYTTRIEAEKSEAAVLLSNGNLVDAGDIPGTSRHFATWHDPFPKPSYLFALVGGNLACVEDSFTTMSGRAVKLAIYVEPGKENRVPYAMDSLKRAMRWDETAFGREYDLDIFMIVAVSAFNMGAMENKGLNVFNDKYVLASPTSATDSDYAGIEAVIAHEYFHNWTGDRITCRDWFQLCLKEGLTVFRDQEFTADQRSRAVERISDVRGLRSHQFVEDAGPLAHPVRPEIYREINNFYTSTVYEKGAEVVRMIRTLIGSALFRQGMDLYFTRHDGQAATVEQFVQCFADVSGRDYFPQFMRWYSQAGTPDIKIAPHYDARAKTLTLDITQTVPPTPGQPDKEPMIIPLALGLIGADGEELPLMLDGRPLERGVLELTQPNQRFVFSGVTERPVPSVNRSFSAPVKLSLPLDSADLRFLAAHDSDPFNRWQAVQTLAMTLLKYNVAALRAGAPPRQDDGLMAVLRGVLENAKLEPAFMALTLAPPSEADIARELGGDVDPDAVFAARRQLRSAIGTHHREALADTYRRMISPGPYRPDAQGAGRRALKNICLDLLAVTETGEDIARAFAQYQSADNMTDRMAALETLALHDRPERAAALDDFYDRYADDPLIIDKWLALQAAIPEPATLDRVRALTKHPALSMTNPNRVRALIGSFAQVNHTQFNRRDGAGYGFVADIVLALDPKNPQVAARLMGAFRSWRALEATRRREAEAVLRRVAAVPALSRDVHDIVARSLAES